MSNKTEDIKNEVEETTEQDTQPQEEINNEDTQVSQSEEEKFASLDEEFKAKMEAKVEEANAKAKESEDKFLRTHADFENIKKRLEREKYSAIDYASEKFAKDLLAPIDALQMTIIAI